MGLRSLRRSPSRRSFVGADQGASGRAIIESHVVPFHYAPIVERLSPMGNIELSKANDYALFLLNIYNLLPALLPVDVAFAAATAAAAAASCAEVALSNAEATATTYVVTSLEEISVTKEEGG